MKRFSGIDPRETVDIEVDSVTFQLGFVPRSKFILLEGRLNRHRQELVGAGKSAQGDLDLPANVLKEIAEHTGDGPFSDEASSALLKIASSVEPEAHQRLAEVNAELHRDFREICRWCVRGWAAEFAALGAATEEWDGTDRHVLDGDSLDAMECRGWIEPVAQAALECYRMTDTEKKS